MIKEMLPGSSGGEWGEQDRERKDIKQKLVSSKVQASAWSCRELWSRKYALGFVPIQTKGAELSHFWTSCWEGLPWYYRKTGQSFQKVKVTGLGQ